MTTNRKLKRVVRKRMEQTGENYTTALRNVKAESEDVRVVGCTCPHGDDAPPSVRVSNGDRD